LEIQAREHQGDCDAIVPPRDGQINRYTSMNTSPPSTTVG
jgi:hypothetical protein